MKFTKILDIIAKYIDKCIERREKKGGIDLDEEFNKKLGLPQITGKNPYRWM